MALRPSLAPSSSTFSGPPNSPAPNSPFQSAPLLISQSSGRSLYQDPVRHLSESGQDLRVTDFFHPRCDFYNDQLSVVFQSRLPHISISCHRGVQRINLTAQTYSSLSDSSQHQIYVIAAARPFPIPEQIAISDMDPGSNVIFSPLYKFEIISGQYKCIFFFSGTGSLCNLL